MGPLEKTRRRGGALQSAPRGTSPDPVLREGALQQGGGMWKHFWWRRRQYGEGDRPGGQDAATWALADGSVLALGLGEAWRCPLI